MTTRMTADDIHTALLSLHPANAHSAWGERWLYIRELRIGTGWGKDREGRIDAYALKLVGTAATRVAYEIKTSRSDYLRELKNPRKRSAARRYAEQFYFATPKGLIAPAELPPDAGLVEVWSDEYGDVQVTRTVIAPVLDTYPPTWTFVASLLRRAGMEGEG